MWFPSLELCQEFSSSKGTLDQYDHEFATPIYDILLFIQGIPDIAEPAPAAQPASEAPAAGAPSTGTTGAPSTPAASTGGSSGTAPASTGQSAETAGKL